MIKNEKVLFELRQSGEFRKAIVIDYLAPLIGLVSFVYAASSVLAISLFEIMAQLRFGIGLWDVTLALLALAIPIVLLLVLRKFSERCIITNKRLIAAHSLTKSETSVSLDEINSVEVVSYPFSISGRVFSWLLEPKPQVLEIKTIYYGKGLILGVENPGEAREKILKLVKFSESRV
ncbi:MAG: hypothetical protein NT157_04645 [Candidatus Micrarchaeota archaeon]|nr:hypothetical protein [Candidatus Micrarchaeota archaeon]